LIDWLFDCGSIVVACLRHATCNTQRATSASFPNCVTQLLLLATDRTTWVENWGGGGVSQRKAWRKIQEKQEPQREETGVADRDRHLALSYERSMEKWDCQETWL